MKVTCRPGHFASIERAAQVWPMIDGSTNPCEAGTACCEPPLAASHDLLVDSSSPPRSPFSGRPSPDYFSRKP